MSTARWRQFRLGIKRLIDIVVAGGLLLVLSPVYVVVYILIRLRMGVPVIFQQSRPGLNGEIFTVKKFRTMITATERNGRPLTDSERVNRLGRALRKTSLDEIPQLWNVLKGEMSLVGPRPLLVEYLAKYSPEQIRRHEMRPGITGLAQTSGRQNLKFSERFILDVKYVDGWGLKMDAKIIGKTIAKVLSGSGVVTGQNVGDFDDLGFLTPPSTADGSFESPDV